MRKISQKSRILQHLKDFGTIEPMTALREYGCYRLGARISDLRHDGYNIETEITVGRNRYGDRTQFATYKYHA